MHSDYPAAHTIADGGACGHSQGGRVEPAAGPSADANGASVFALVRRAVDHRLDALLPPAEGGARGPHAVAHAMRAAALGSGKRIRPLLMVCTARALGLRDEVVLDAACALEMVHAASLLLDDLPCMDDALERRGQPAVHRSHGEDVAVLAAVALLARAFSSIAACEALPPVVRLQVQAALASAVGPDGLVQGQLRDLHDDPAATDEQALGEVNDLKTGSLFRVALQVPAMAAGCEASSLEALARAAAAIGQAFQLRDDLDDGGRIDGAGEDDGKVNLVALLGPDAAAARLRAAVERAGAELARALPDTALLQPLLARLLPSQVVPSDARTEAPQAATARGGDLEARPDTGPPIGAMSATVRPRSRAIGSLRAA